MRVPLWVRGSDHRAQCCLFLCAWAFGASWRMVNLQPFLVATLAFRNLDIGLQTGVVHGRHQERAASLSEQRRARMIPRSRVDHGEHFLPMSAALSQMRDSTPNEVVASCNAVALLVRSARATSRAPNCDLVGINSGDSQRGAQWSAFFVEQTRKRLGDCRMCSDMYSGCTACLRSACALRLVQQ